MLRLLSITIILLVVSSLRAQVPTNDSCHNAIVLTPSTTTNYLKYKISDATSDTTGCRDDKDVWFKFEMPSTGGIRIVQEEYQLSQKSGLRLFEGSCGSLTSYACTGTCDYYSGNNCGTTLLLKDPAIHGDTIYIRAAKFYSFTTGDSGKIAIIHIPDAEWPDNNDCATATTLDANSILDMDTFTLENSITELNTSFCREDEDVWFKFEVPASGNFEIVQDKYKNTSDVAFRVYEGGCGSLTDYACDGTCNYINATTNCGTKLTVGDTSLSGDTVWVRVSPFYTFQNRDSFAIGIKELSPILNEKCADAIDISYTTSSGFDTFSIQNAKSELTSGHCREEEDVWFKFEVPASGAFYVKQDKYLNTSELSMQLYEYDCASPVQYDCNGTCNYLQPSGNCSQYLQVVDTSLIGDTMMLRMSPYYSFQNRDSFMIKIVEVPSSEILPNDICESALAISTHSTLSPDTFTLLNCLSEISSSCKADNDVWFKMEVPTSGAFELETKKIGNEHNVFLQVWTGSCGSLIQYECDSNCNFLNGSNTCATKVLIRDTSLANDTIYVRVSNQYSTGVFGSFSIAARAISISELPNNDDCSGAMAMSVTQGGCLVDTFNNINTTASEVPGSCGIYKGADVWFKFEMPASDDVFIEMSQVSATAKNFNIAAYSGGCQALSQIGCNTSGNYPSLSLRNLSLAGDTVYLKMNINNSNVSGDTFGLCVKDTVIPAIRGVVGQYEKTAGCESLIGGDWFDLVDNLGGLVMSVNPQGNSLGSTCFGINLEDSAAVLRTEIDTSGNTAYVSPRNFYISPQFNNKSALIRLYFKEREIKIWRDSLSARGIAVGADLQEFYEDSMRLSKTDGSDLNSFGGPNAISINPTVTKVRDSILMAEFSVTSFSNFVPIFNPGHPLTPVPVEWLSFSGSRKSDVSILKWATASELHCSHFEVQRSYDGLSFQTVGVVKGSGTVSSISRYTFSEQNSSSVIIYYRLKQIDYDGNFDYSNVIVLDSKSNIDMYPNPFTSNLEVSSGKKEILKVEILDLFGRVVFEQEVHSNKVNLELGNQIDHGVYVLRIVTLSGVIEKRIVKK